MEFDISRSSEVFNPEFVDKDIHVIGAGATGSFVIQTLVRFGVKKLHIWDFDIYEAHNVNNQAILQECVDKPKVEAQKELCEKINPNVEIIAHNEKVTPEKINEIPTQKDIANIANKIFAHLHCNFNKLTQKTPNGCTNCVHGGVV